MSVPYDLYDYTTFWEGRDYEDLAEKLVLNDFYQKVTNKDLIVDVGGGYGRLIPLYARLFNKCVLIDPSERNLKTGKEKFGDFNNVSFARGSLPILPLDSNLASLVQMIRVSHHITNLTKAISEIWRILDNDGFLIIEVANKVHIAARIKALRRGDFNFAKDLNYYDQRSEQSIKKRNNLFVNHHPEYVLQLLRNSGFKILEIRSVSNLRNQTLKKWIPMNLLIKTEKRLQKPLGKLFFGPSIFILAKKTI